MNKTKPFMNGALDEPSSQEERGCLHSADYAAYWLPVAAMLAKELITWIFGGKKRGGGILDRMEITGDKDYPVKFKVKF